jgi:putative zinc finger/helix-turn-helix YgiT family protein
MTCHGCGSSMVSKFENHKYDACGLDNVTILAIEVRRCPKCGQSEPVIPRIEELHRVLARAVASAKSRLSGREIVFLRKYLGLSGVDYAKAIGVDPATVSRWENGKTEMSPSYERFLRLMVFNQHPAQSYPPGDLATVPVSKPKKTRFELRGTGSSWQAAAC